MPEITYQNSYDNFLNKNTLKDLNDWTTTNVNNLSNISDGAIQLDQTGIPVIGANEEIKSSNFSPWKRGWRIKWDGSAEFRNVTIAGYKLFEAIIAADWSGNYTSIWAALADWVKRIFVRNWTYNNEPEWNLNSAWIVIQWESRDWVIVNFAENNSIHPWDARCIHITDSVTITSMTLNGYDFSTTNVQVFDTFPAVINTAKWTETDPSSLINWYDEYIDSAFVSIPHTSTRSLFSTKIQSVSSVSSWVATFTWAFQWIDAWTNEAICSIGLYIDNNNYAMFQSRTATWDFLRLVIVQWWVTRYNQEINTFSQYQYLKKITYNISTKDIKFWYYDWAWIQMWTTQNWNLWTTTYACASFSDAVSYTNCDWFYLDFMALSSVDHTTDFPFVQQTLIYVATSNPCIFNNLKVKNNRWKCFYWTNSWFHTARDIFFDYTAQTDVCYSFAFQWCDWWNITWCTIDATTLPIYSNKIRFFQNINNCLISNIRISSRVQNVIYKLWQWNSTFENCYFECQEIGLQSHVNNSTFYSNWYAPSWYFISTNYGQIKIQNNTIILNDSYNLLNIKFTSTIFNNNLIDWWKKIYVDWYWYNQIIWNNWVSWYTVAVVNLELAAGTNKNIVTNNVIRNNSGSFTPTITDSWAWDLVSTNILSV